MTIEFPAFVCNTCGYRFSVASNLKRHARKCVLRPVNSHPLSISDKPQSEDCRSEAVPVTPEFQCGTSNDAVVSNRAVAIDVASESSTTPSSQTGKRVYGDDAVVQGPSSLAQRPKPTAKRRRRAPSPMRWVPDSLLAFDLCPIEATKATSVPLPPVMPARDHPFEERNSWDTSFGRRPYHPEEWLGKLPGPGFVGGEGGFCAVASSRGG